MSGSEKGVFWKRGLFRKVHFLEILENLEILEILENRQTVENKEESDHCLEILENLEILEILEIPLVKRPLSLMTPFSGPKFGGRNICDAARSAVDLSLTFEPDAADILLES